MDGSVSIEGSGTQFITASLEQYIYEHAPKFMFKASNNEVQYGVFLAGVEIWDFLRAKHVNVFSNS